MRPPWILLAPLAAGCAGWPLYSDLPEPDPGSVEAPEDPRSLLDPTWEETAEGDDVDDPTLLDPHEILAGEGVLVSGTLGGLGWSDAAEPATIASDDCDSEHPRNPFDQGDWIGDVDFVLLEIAEEGQLCAEVATDRPDVGWDLLLARTDPCGVPEAFVEAGAEPLGFGLGGGEGGWGTPVAAGTYAVLFAGYFPNDREDEVPYRLGLSLMHPSTDDVVDPCPLLPEVP